MKNCLRSFNTYLLLLAILLTAGCASEASKKKKEMATLRMHLEVNQDGTGRSGPVPVTREKILVNVEKEPFLLEDEIAQASIVESVGGFEIRLLLTPHGSLVLDMKTSSSKGQRIAILTQSQKNKITKSRWIAAPVISKRIGTGVFTFTPDMSREEAEQMVNGLNNVAAKVRKQASFF